MRTLCGFLLVSFAWLLLEAQGEELRISSVSVEAKRNDSTTRASRLIERLETASDNYIMVAAHRGDWRNAPENSLQAIQNCIQMGVDIVEIDIKSTKDGHLVLMHDKTLDRTTTGSGRIDEHTLREISGLRLLNGYGLPTHHEIPTLNEAMSTCKDHILVYLDKTYDCIPEAYQILQETGTVDQAIFYGVKSAADFKADYGELCDKIRYMPKVNGSPQHDAQYVEDFVRDCRPSGFLVHFDREDSLALSHIPRIRKHGIRVWTSPLWSEICAGHTDDVAVHDPHGAWGWLIDRGASILCTDRPALLLEYLRSRNLHD